MGETEIVVILYLVYNGLRHTSLMEIKKSGCRLTGYTSYESLLNIVVGRSGMVCPRQLRKAMGTKFKLIANQRPATMTTDCGKNDVQKLVERTYVEVRHGIKAGTGNYRHN